MSNNLFKVNAKDIIGGPGRLVSAPFGVDFPTKIADVMDPNTYELKGPWDDLGATMEGIETSRGFETEDTIVDQFQGAVDTEVTQWNHTVTTILAENTVKNRQLALIGGPIIETPPELGTAATAAGELAIGATIIALSAAPGPDFKELGFLRIGNETLQINKIAGNSIYLSEPLANAQPANTSVYPVKALGTKRIGYGAVSNIPEITLVLITQKKDGCLGMAVFRKCKVAAEDKAQSYGKAKRGLPLQLQAFTVDGVPTTENVYYEIEEVR